MAETWTPVGKVTPTPKGAWSSSTSYARLDIVSNNGASYIAIQGVPAGTAITNTSYWQKFADKGDTGATGATGNGVASIVVTETSTSGSAHNYRMAITMTNGNVTNVDYTVTDGAVTSVNGRTGAVTGLAEDDGYYEDMTVGGAEQLISSTYVEDSVPYVFRTSGGSADIGDREFDEIHGGTIAWNQLYSGLGIVSATINGVTFTLNEDKTITVNGTATADAYFSINVWFGNTAAQAYKVPNGHKTIIKGCPNGGSESTYFMMVRYLLEAYKDIGNGIIVTTNDTVYNGVLSICVKSGTVMNNVVFKPNVFDITQTFGSTIADYIYSLEQSNTGSGVAWFKSLFPKPYYAYNAGELISVSGLSAHKMTGFNQFDVDNANLSPGDFINETSGSVTNVVTRNYTRVVGGTTYAWSQTAFNDGGARYVRFYDADKNFITGINLYGNGIKTFTSPANACYAKFMWYKPSNVSVADVRNGQVCISFDSEKNGQYEPYESHSYALDDSLTLRGIPKLNSSNEMYFDGDVYASDGSVERRYGIVDLGTLTFSASTNFFYRANSQDLGIIADVQAPIIAVDTNIDYVYYYSSSHQLRVYVKDVTKPLTGSLVYLLATPITESAEPYVNPQICNEYGTEEYISAEQSGVTMIVGHNTKYPQNLRKKIEGLPWNFSNLIAPTEVTNKASRNYTVGSFLIMNNTLYKVTSAIANGGTITVGSNVSATTIMQEILAL